MLIPNLGAYEKYSRLTGFLVFRFPVMTTLVLGIGNEWASDDGAGPEVVRRAQVRWRQDGRNTAGGVEFSILAQPDLSLLDRLPVYADLIVVDAVVSGAPPGALHYEKWDPGMLAARGVQRASSHGFGIRELLQMAAVMGRLPENIELWGIEIASTEPGQGLSPEVEQAVDGVVEALRERLNTDS
jgi:hydrogenase maturation protease